MAAGSREAVAAVPPPIPEPHFPSRLYQFVWRNWELANTNRMAEVVHARAADILALGASTGLPRKPVLTPDQLRRIYITVIRQNWHLLPEAQIVQLLGWTPERFAFTLKEDDFLGIKLGPKPECAALVFAASSATDIARAAQVRRTVQEIMGPLIHERGEPRLQFVQDFSRPARTVLREEVRPAPGEIDLSRGWRVVIPADETVAPAALRLRDYLRTVMLAALDGKREITLGIVESSAGFRTQASPDSVRISGSSSDAILQAIDWLQDDMERRGAPFLREGITERRVVWDPRYLYSYFALYGDPLLENGVDPLPDAYLERLARAGINGVWIQAVLNTLAPAPQFPNLAQEVRSDWPI